jgi:hypothetical protein
MRPSLDAPKPTQPTTTEKTPEIKPVRCRHRSGFRHHQERPRQKRQRDHDYRACRDSTAPTTEPAKEPTKAASNVPPADQPVADKLREMLGGEIVALFRPQGRTNRGREILHRA